MTLAPTEPLFGTAVLALVALQRGVEVLFARRNARELVARGAHLADDDGTPVLVVLHALWLAAMAVERAVFGARSPDGTPTAFVVALALVEALRAWTLLTLGRRWTIRVVVVPGEAPVARGPYRFVRHPNYLVVMVEVLLVPLGIGAWRTAATFALPHALALLDRIRREERAWRERGGRPLGARRA